MQLAKKKELASRVLGVGKERTRFAPERLEEIKEAITRQDILDLYHSGAIKIKEANGRRKIQRRKNRRGAGKIKKKIKATKKDYVIITRKLRKHAKFLLKDNRINKVNYKNIQRMIKAKKFKSKRHLNESLSEV